MGQIDQFTQQNAAFVGERATAVASLREQAQELFKGVPLFRLPEGVDHAPTSGALAGTVARLGLVKSRRSGSIGLDLQGLSLLVIVFCDGKQGFGGEACAVRGLFFVQCGQVARHSCVSSG